jgi:hypothetical protein
VLLTHSGSRTLTAGWLAGWLARSIGRSCGLRPSTLAKERLDARPPAVHLDRRGACALMPARA